VRWRRAAALSAAAVLLSPAVAAGPAQAEPASAAQVRELARAAARDDGALARLRRIDAVDGRRLDVAAVVAGARPDEVAARIDLALDSAQASGAPARGSQARERARDVLDDRRYTGTSVPSPFTGALRWLAGRLDPVGRFIDRIIAAIPGGQPIGYAVLALLVLGTAALITRMAIRRGAGRSGAGRPGRPGRREDPAALERAADAAERAGAFEDAVRLRFRAGLLRLDAGRMIDYRPSLTTGEVARTLGSPGFEALGRDFDAIAYGGRKAGSEHADAAREGWKSVLAETTPAGRA